MHVLVEKPFAMSHSDALACFSLARSKGVHLQQGMMHRLHPELQLFGAALRDGRIGTLEEIDLNFGFVLETHGRARTVAGGGGAITLDRHDPQSWRNFSVDWINEESERVSLPIEKSGTEPSGSSLFLFERQFRNFVQACGRAAEPLVSESDSVQNARVLECFLSEISAQR